MAMQGTIEVDGKGGVFVRYESVRSSEPVRDVMYWRVQRVTRNPYRAWRSPETGDIVRNSVGSNEWHGDGYSVSFPGNQQAERRETHPIPCPKVRAGIETRWNIYESRWEKLQKKGWVPA